MKKTLLSTMFLISCANQIPVDTTNTIAQGVALKEVLDQVEKTLPKYQKKLKLPSIEICYFLNSETVYCKIVGCHDDPCSKEYDIHFVEKYKEESFFIKKESVYFLLSFLNTFCNFDEKRNICTIEKKNYESIRKVLIYE